MIRRTKKRERFVPRDMKNPSAAKASSKLQKLKLV
jgi:hypothetical protein